MRIVESYHGCSEPAVQFRGKVYHVKWAGSQRPALSEASVGINSARQRSKHRGGGDDEEEDEDGGVRGRRRTSESRTRRCFTTAPTSAK